MQKAVRVRSYGWLKRTSTAIVLLLMVTASQRAGHAQAGDALPFAKGFLVTGNYVIGGVDLDPKATSNGFVTGTVSISGVPATGEVLAAYLYWETISTDIAQVNGAKFRGSPVTVVKASSTALSSSTAACWSSGGGAGATYTMTMFRADVLHLLPVQLDATGKPNGHRLVNDVDLLNNGFPRSTVTLPEGGTGNQVPSGAGATLFVVYRDPAESLTKIALYDGIYVQPPGAVMNQTIRGFYQSAPNKFARMTQIVGGGAPNSTDRLYFNGSRIAAEQGRPEAPAAATGYATVFHGDEIGLIGQQLRIDAECAAQGALDLRGPVVLRAQPPGGTGNQRFDLRDVGGCRFAQDDRHEITLPPARRSAAWRTPHRR